MTLEIWDMEECEVMISLSIGQFVPGRHVGLIPHYTGGVYSTQ
jgi:hypothetical protein